MDQKKVGQVLKEVLVVIWNGLHLILSAWAFTRIPDKGRNLGLYSSYSTRVFAIHPFPWTYATTAN